MLSVGRSGRWATEETVSVRPKAAEPAAAMSRRKELVDFIAFSRTRKWPSIRLYLRSFLVFGLHLKLRWGSRSMRRRFSDPRPMCCSCPEKFECNLGHPGDGAAGLRMFAVRRSAQQASQFREFLHHGLSRRAVG